MPNAALAPAAINWTSTLEFDNRAEALEFLELGRFRRLPVPGLIERWVADEAGDNGEDLLTFASSAGGLTFNLRTMEKKRKR